MNQGSICCQKLQFIIFRLKKSKNTIKNAGQPHRRSHRVTDHALIGEAKNIPVCASTPVITISPVVIPAPGRLAPLQIKVSAPMTGGDLPIILLSHGHGRSNNLSSLNGYAPLANFSASHSFVVIQPTHLSSKTLNLDSKLLAHHCSGTLALKT
jgi:hypothetical protein